MQMNARTIKCKQLQFSIGNTIMIRIVVVVAMLANAVISTATTLSSLSIQDSKNKTTIACKLSNLPKYKSFILRSPYRVVVDFQNTTATNRILQKNFSKRMIKNIRIGHPSSKITRFVFDLRQDGKVSAVWVKSRRHNDGVLHINISNQKNNNQFVKKQSNMHFKKNLPKQFHNQVYNQVQPPLYNQAQKHYKLQYSQRYPKQASKHQLIHNQRYNQPQLFAFNPQSSHKASSSHKSSYVSPQKSKNFAKQQPSHSMFLPIFSKTPPIKQQPVRNTKYDPYNSTHYNADVDSRRRLKSSASKPLILTHGEAHPWIINGGIGYTWYNAGYSESTLPSSVSANKIGDGKTAFGRFVIGRDLFAVYPILTGLELGFQSGNIERLNVSQDTLDLMGGLPIQANIKPMVDLLLTATTEPLVFLPVYGVLKLGAAYRRMQINDRITVNDLAQTNFELEAGFGRRLSDRLNIALLYQGIFSGKTQFTVNAQNEIGNISNIPAQNGLLLNLTYRL